MESIPCYRIVIGNWEAHPESGLEYDHIIFQSDVYLNIDIMSWYNIGNNPVPREIMRVIYNESNFMIMLYVKITSGITQDLQVINYNWL